jgi:hypothetical protein
VSHGWHLWETVRVSGRNSRYTEKENNPTQTKFQADARKNVFPFRDYYVF